MESYASYNDLVDFQLGDEASQWSKAQSVKRLSAATQTINSFVAQRYAIPLLDPATGTVTFSGNPSDDDTVTIGDQVFRFKDSTEQANDIVIGSTLPATILNLFRAINGLPGSITAFHPGTEMSAYAKATSYDGTSISLEYRKGGPEGNTAILAASVASVTAFAGGSTYDYPLLTQLACDMAANNEYEGGQVAALGTPNSGSVFTVLDKITFRLQAIGKGKEKLVRSDGTQETPRSKALPRASSRGRALSKYDKLFGGPSVSADTGNVGD